MKSITYIKRNLTNLNRSILSQLLQSEGVELTDGLWNYLIETPWNTNWRLLGDFGIDIDENSEGGSDTVTLTRVGGNKRIEYYTECGDETKYFEDTLVIPKGATLYFSTVNGLATSINGTPIEAGECVPHTFATDSTIKQIWEE